MIKSRPHRPNKRNTRAYAKRNALKSHKYVDRKTAIRESAV